MKLIITEKQANQLGLENKSDVLYKLMMLFFPENYESETSNNETTVFDDEDTENMLFYYDFDTKEFYVWTEFIRILYQSTGLPFLNIDKVLSEEREGFEELIKVFAKRYYGWNVDKVWFHWH